MDTCRRWAREGWNVCDEIPLASWSSSSFIFTCRFLFVSQAEHKGGIHPGKVVDGADHCNISWVSAVQLRESIFDRLTFFLNCRAGKSILRKSTEYSLMPRPDQPLISSPRRTVRFVRVLVTKLNESLVPTKTKMFCFVISSPLTPGLKGQAGVHGA